MRAALALCVAALLAACGFHLRGAGSAALPESLREMRVVMPDRAAFPPLLVEMRNALKSQAGVRLLPLDVSGPTLSLFGEFFESQEFGRDPQNAPLNRVASYKVSFSLKDVAGRDIISRQTVRTQREYSFRKENVLATEKEADYLYTEMRRDAVQQILRRLAALNGGG